MDVLISIVQLARKNNQNILKINFRDLRAYIEPSLASLIVIGITIAAMTRTVMMAAMQPFVKAVILCGMRLP